MSNIDLNYLRGINQQLGGTIKQAVGDGMAGHLLTCIHHLLSSLIAEQSGAQEAQAGALATCREHLPQLRQLLAASGEDARLLECLEQHCNEGHAADATAFARDLAQLACRLAKRDEAAAKQILAALVACDTQRWKRVDDDWEALCASADNKVDREVEPLSADAQARLLTLLRQEHDEGESLAITNVKALAGGLSKQTILVTLSGNRVLPTEIVLRRDRAESPVGSTVIDEYDLLQVVHAAGLAVPKPLAIDSGAITGSPILVSTKASGSNLGTVYDIHDRSKPLAAPTLAQELAKLHRIPLESLKRPLPGIETTHNAQLRNEIESFHRDWRALNESSVVIEAAFEWLFARLEHEEGGRCITHRDIRFHNILTDASGVTAILDWELAAVGRPARDLGYVYHHIIQFADWTEFLASYRAAGGDVPSEDELDFYILWSDLFVVVYMYRARAGYLSHPGDNIQMAYAGERMRQHNMRILSERLQGLLKKAR